MKNSSKDIFKAMGVRVTPQHLETLRILETCNEHPAAEDVYKKIRKLLPSISFDTVYQTLSLYENHGQIRKIHHLADKTRYDTNMRHHHHFVCVRCKKNHRFHLGWDRRPLRGTSRDLSYLPEER